jgi:hypothetical protein
MHDVKKSVISTEYSNLLLVFWTWSKSYVRWVGGLWLMKCSFLLSVALFESARWPLRVLKAQYTVCLIVGIIQEPKSHQCDHMVSLSLRGSPRLMNDCSHGHAKWFSLTLLYLRVFVISTLKTAQCWRCKHCTLTCRYKIQHLQVMVQ